LIGRLKTPYQQPSLQSVLALAAYQQATRTLIESDGTTCCMYTTISSWRWAFDARNM